MNLMFWINLKGFAITLSSVKSIVRKLGNRSVKSCYTHFILMTDNNVATKFTNAWKAFVS